MTVKQLKVLIANLPDRTPVLVPASAYRDAKVEVTSAIFDTKDYSWSEWVGETPFFVTAYRENVIVIS